MTVGSEFRNPMDELVVGSMRTLTGNTGIGISDDFFDIGGDSIIAIRLGQILSEHLGMPRNIRIIFKHPKLSELSDALSDLAGDAA